MRVSQIVIQKLKENYPLRELICDRENIREATLDRRINRNSKKLTDYLTVKIIKEYTGFTKEEIFEKETSNN